MNAERVRSFHLVGWEWQVPPFDLMHGISLLCFSTSVLATRKLKGLLCKKKTVFHLVWVRMAGAPVWLLLLLALISLIFRSSTSLFSFLGILTKQWTCILCAGLRKKSYYQTHVFIILPQFKPHLILKCDFCIPNIFWSKPGCFWAQTLQSLDGSQLQICRTSCQSEEGGLINFSKLYFLT